MIHDGTISTGSACTCGVSARTGSARPGVAQHHLARRDRHVAADLERAPRARPAASRWPPASTDPPASSRSARCKVPAARFSAFAFSTDRVGRQPVGRCQHAQPLACQEVGQHGVVARHAGQARRRMPPGSRHCGSPRARHVEGPVVPRRGGGNAGRRRRRRRVRVGSLRRSGASGLASCAASAARSICRPGDTAQVPGPVGPGQRQRHRRQAAGQRRGAAACSSAVEPLGG
jgi:hypothetical protein